MGDKDQRTEKPTAQRLKKARSDGRFAVSREFVGALQFGAIVALVSGVFPSIWTDSLHGMRSLLRAAFISTLSPATVQLYAIRVVQGLAVPTLAVAGALLGVGLLTQLATTGFGLSASRLAPEWSRLNPMKKASELWGNNLRSTLESAMLLPLFLLLLWFVISANLPEFLMMPSLPLPAALKGVGASLSSLLFRSAGLLLVWGAIDLFKQKRRYMKELRMTKQEIREEWKQNEGNPEVKMRLRRIRRDLLRRRMMSEVPTATAVIVNPTHYAVAIKYDVNAMPAPKVVAKGKNYLALRIRQKAMEHQVPIIENKPLAQALYKQCDVGQEIPANLYRAAAEVLAYVYRLMNGTRGKKGF